MWCNYQLLRNIFKIMYLKLIPLLLPSALSSPLKIKSENASFSCLQGELLTHPRIFKALCIGLTEGSFHPSQQGGDRYCPDQHSGNIRISQCPEVGQRTLQVTSPADCHFRVSPFTFHVNLWSRTSVKSHLTSSHFSSSFMLCIRKKSHWRICCKTKHVANWKIHS